MSERRHFVFLDRCGCPVGVSDTISGFEPDAWRDMYGPLAAQREASRMGVTARLVDHDTLVREYYDLMTGRCSHA